MRRRVLASVVGTGHADRGHVTTCALLLWISCWAGQQVQMGMPDYIPRRRALTPPRIMTNACPHAAGLLSLPAVLSGRGSQVEDIEAREADVSACWRLRSAKSTKH